MVSHSITSGTSVLGVMNEAIRYIAKELYRIESSLLRASLSVSIWAEVTSTGDDIAFVDSDPDTLTSSTTDFEDDGFVAGMHFTTDSANNPGPFEIDTVAANLITLISTDELSDESSGTEFTLTSIDDYGDLPSDFWGLMTEPYLSGYTWPLKPLPSQDVKLPYLLSTGLPKYYEIKGTRLYVTPPTGTDHTVCGDYFAKPTAISAATDTLPWNELLDDVIAEYMKTYFAQARNKLPMVFPQSLIQQIHDVSHRYGKQHPTPLTNNDVPWDAFM